ncbi:hypothetical protein [Brachyspira innocens]|uniref:hypothetical protein n=1 Tax=Brachyspira innocens TaxID=13264 RepID=UPI00035F15FC|nr:hypothetical protein [Brachyspira innocens]
MNIDKLEYKEFLLKSIFYDIDSIISFLSENSEICQKFFCHLKNKFDKLSVDYDEVLNTVSKELESII